MRLIWIAALLAGCSLSDRGAVELSWAFRPASSSLPDKFVSCNANDEGGSNPIDRIALSWDVDGETGEDSWPCINFTGTTTWQLPVGTAMLSLHPICIDDLPLDPASYIAPAPFVREVAADKVVSLGAVQFVIQVSSCLEQPCICHR